MKDVGIERLLEEAIPPFGGRADGWADVLARARRTRHRYAFLAVAAAAFLLVPPAVALHGRIADIFEGTAAPPAVVTNFEAQNKMTDLATQKGFGSKFPHAEVSEAHGVLEVQTSDGPEDLWAAPDDQGGQCWWIDWANDPDGPAGKFGFGGCQTSASRAAPSIDWGSIWVEPHPTLLTLYGQVLVPATKVEVRLEDGSTTTLPVVEGFFLHSLERGARVVGITAYDASGQEVATSSRP